MPTLVAEKFSPWSEKARWALDHHRLAYAYREHYPLIGELTLRLRARRPTGRVSTPMLLTAEGPLIDSFDIARYAEREGGAAPLFPAGHEEALGAWNARSEAALRSARVLDLERLGESRAAKVELQPDALPLAAEYPPGKRLSPHPESSCAGSAPATASPSWSFHVPLRCSTYGSSWEGRTYVSMKSQLLLLYS